MKTKQKIDVVLKNVFLSSRDHMCLVHQLYVECRRLGFDDATVLKGIHQLMDDAKVRRAGSRGFQWIGGEIVDL